MPFLKFLVGEYVMKRIVVVVLLLANICSSSSKSVVGDGASTRSSCYCLSWRTAVEADNIRAWRTVPAQCLRHVQKYMIGGQYEGDLNLIVDNIISYINLEITPADDGLDAWILDVDDTCLSNIFYYQAKRFGVEPYDPVGFKTWASKGGCPAIPAVLRLFNKLVERGFKVFLITGRDEETLGQITLNNLRNQGFIGFQRLILRLN